MFGGVGGSAPTIVAAATDGMCQVRKRLRRDPPHTERSVVTTLETPPAPSTTWQPPGKTHVTNHKFFQTRSYPLYVGHRIQSGNVLGVALRQPNSE